MRPRQDQRILFQRSRFSSASTRLSAPLRLTTAEAIIPILTDLLRILVDYRPALRERTGVGEYIHQLVHAYAARHPGEMSLFTSSWKDRPASAVTRDLGADVIDRRIPV